MYINKFNQENYNIEENYDIFFNKLISNIINKYEISSDYLIIKEISLKKINEKFQFPIKGRCIAFSLIIASELLKNYGIKSNIIITKDQNNHFHIYLKSKDYIIKPFEAINIKEFTDYIIFEKEYNGEDNIYELIKEYNLLKLIINIKDIIDKCILPRGWNHKYNKIKRIKRAKRFNTNLKKNLNNNLINEK